MIAFQNWIIIALLCLIAYLVEQIWLKVKGTDN